MTVKKGLLATDLEGAVWTKSSYSGDAQGQCVEVADLTTTSRHGVAIRDSKAPTGPALLFGPASFAGFIANVAGKRFDG
ncbi:DUF397 domain-containing protein [Streptomyces sp. NPDC088124]|uniref:DUF397 domain-containing protein n=1 Tax=Streptomyces sp. NPDC088124 TaxID=3154654 RepID=UPI003425BCEC